MSAWYLLFIGVAAFLWALMEVEIEGVDGWAAKLPTWRIEKHVLLDVFYGGRPLTGYHLWAFAFLMFVLHQPFFWGIPWTFRHELQIVGCYFLFWVVEDFSWFVLNPHYGLSKYEKKYVWWHKRWFLGLPVDYWVLGTAGVLLIFMR